MNGLRSAAAGVLAAMLSIAAPRAAGAQQADAPDPQPPTSAADPAETAFDPDAPADETFRALPNLSIGVRFDLDAEWRNNRDDLRSGDDDHDLSLQPQARLTADWKVNEDVEFVFDGRYTYDSTLAGDGQSEGEFELRALYVDLDDFPGKDLELRIGRQRFADDREWLYDARLDGVRFEGRWGDFSLDTSLSTDLIDPSGDADRAVNLITRGTWRYARRHRLVPYAILRYRTAGDDGNRLWTGLSWRARPSDDQNLWVDTALLIGRDHDDDRDLRSYAIDAGWTHRFAGQPFETSVTVAAAYGSGDSDPGGGSDGNFRQTGLHENSDRFNGDVAFQYYGEALDPQLSNIFIATAGVGVRPSRQTSFDVVYHYYLQAAPLNNIRAAIDVNPTSDSRALGHALDVVYGIRFDRKTRLAIIGGVFLPGQAFEERDPVTSLGFEFRINL